MHFHVDVLHFEESHNTYAYYFRLLREAHVVFQIYPVIRFLLQREFRYRAEQSRDSDTLDFAFNMSLSAINFARQFGAQYSTPLSVGDVKVLLHNEAMAERLFPMFGNRPNLKINNTDFKELLFYGVRAAT